MPPLSMASKYVNQASPMSFQSLVNSINPPIEPIKDSVIVPHSSQQISSKENVIDLLMNSIKSIMLKLKLVILLFKNTYLLWLQLCMMC